MSELAEKVQKDLVEAIDNDDLVLPTLPEVALQIRQAAENPEVSVSTLSKVIGRDTALSARLIKVVNSPLLRADPGSDRSAYRDHPSGHQLQL